MEIKLIRLGLVVVVGILMLLFAGCGGSSSTNMATMTPTAAYESGHPTPEQIVRKKLQESAPAISIRSVTIEPLSPYSSEIRLVIAWKMSGTRRENVERDLRQIVVPFAQGAVNVDYERLVLYGWADLQDRYGNVAPAHVITVGYLPSTLARINLDNIRAVKLLNLDDHPNGLGPYVNPGLGWAAK